MDLDLTQGLIRDFKKLNDNRENDEDSNVYIRVGKGLDANGFKAHSIILKNRSEYFRNVLTENVINKRGNKLFKKGDLITFDIPHISAVTFKNILSYIYTGKFSLDGSNSQEYILDLIFTADELKLHDLVKCLQTYMIENHSNWIKHNLNRIYQIPIMQGCCVKLIEREPTLLFRSYKFFSLNESDLIKLLKRDDLGLQEIEIWKYLINWGIEQNPPITSLDTRNWNGEFVELKKRLCRLIPYIRFFTISAAQFYEEVRPYIKILPDELIDEIEAFYILPNRLPPPNALPPRFRHPQQNVNINQMWGNYNAISGNPPFNRPPGPISGNPPFNRPPGPISGNPPFNRPPGPISGNPPFNRPPGPISGNPPFNMNNRPPPQIPPPIRMDNLHTISTPISSQIPHEISPHPLYYTNEKHTKLINSPIETTSPILDFTEFDSILINKHQAKRIARWIDETKRSRICGEMPNHSYEFNLLARGKRDGMRQEIFHSLCDNKGPTVVIANVEKTTDIIGGYNPKSWKSSNIWIETAESFIFSFKSDGNREGIDDIILSRVKHPSVAIFDGDSSYDVAFSNDLQLFNGICEHKNYEKKIMSDNKFTIINYEVFQIKKR